MDNLRRYHPNPKSSGIAPTYSGPSSWYAGQTPLGEGKVIGFLPVNSVLYIEDSKPEDDWAALTETGAQIVEHSVIIFVHGRIVFVLVDLIPIAISSLDVQSLILVCPNHVSLSLEEGI